MPVDSISGVDAGALYGLPLERFVPERKALARAFRAEGQREAAVDVERRRKPTVAAWAVNQVVRTQARAVAALFDAGDTVRQAQEDALAGRGDGRALRAAAERERTAVDDLVDAARGLLTSDGHGLSAAIIERVADTLHAAALDDSARAAVSDGCLERELRHVGLGVGASESAALGRQAATGAERRQEPNVEERRDPPRARQSDVPRRTALERERSAQERALVRRSERERVNARKAARAEESEARRVARLAARALKVAERLRDRASQALDEAEEALARARAQAKTSADAHRRAKEKLGTLDST